MSKGQSNDGGKPDWLQNLNAWSIIVTIFISSFGLFLLISGQINNSEARQIVALDKAEARLTTRLDTNEMRLNDLFGSVSQIQGRLDISGAGDGELPPPGESTLGVALNINDPPSSSLIAESDPTWVGFFPTVAEHLGNQLGFSETAFLTAQEVEHCLRNGCVPGEYSYLVIILDEAEPLYDLLIAQRWVARRLSPYFTLEESNPNKYLILIPPWLAEVGYMVTLATALDQLPWNDLVNEFYQSP